MEACPCGGASYEECCKPFHSESAIPETAEALMRSRYCAFAKSEIGYLEKTLHPQHRSDFDKKSTREWAQQSEWVGLEILNSKGGAADKDGEVEFVASYRQKGFDLKHHEVSQFKKVDGRWYFVSGRIVPEEGRVVYQNDPCICGSGKKYKRCCGKKAA